MMAGRAEDDPDNLFVYDSKGNVRNEKQRRAYYRNHWRRRQMSDHLIMWLGSTTTRTAGGLDFPAICGKRQGREVPHSLWVEPGASHPVWKTQLKIDYGEEYLKKRTIES
jgi:hypothetical protein